MHSKALKAIMFTILVCLLAFPFSAAARGVRGAVIGNRAVFVHAYPNWAWGGWGDPFWGYYGPYYYPVDTRGRIKIKDFNNFDQVYLNGAYAGTVDDMKSIRLEPGRYNIEIRGNGKPIVDREVYVVSGKTVEIRGNERNK